MRVRSALTIIAFTTAAVLAGPALAQGDPAEGEKIFRKCKACHATEQGTNKVGPSLYNIIGKKPGSVEGYSYSKAMEAYGQDHVWNEKTLSAYLEKPRDVVKGTKMMFVGLNDAEDRQDIIAYLKQFGE